MVWQKWKWEDRFSNEFSHHFILSRVIFFSWLLIHPIFCFQEHSEKIYFWNHFPRYIFLVLGVKLNFCFLQTLWIFATPIFWSICTLFQRLVKPSNLKLHCIFKIALATIRRYNLEYLPDTFTLVDSSPRGVSHSYSTWCKVCSTIR